ncbi:unnamed protein product [Acanthocheilonema viteae]|uniref:Uncharacterized protein n=1 Tax=Acanthocheilonema viteae TaxID=6277 RepID=A0A498SFX5_ACAVI|nr:unnamed protein product [Acanthocheilonema viteae]
MGVGREEKSEWSEPVVLHVVDRGQTNNLGIAFEELVKKMGEKAHPELTWRPIRAAGQGVPGRVSMQTGS